MFEIIIEEEVNGTASMRSVPKYPGGVFEFGRAGVAPILKYFCAVACRACGLATYLRVLRDSA